MKLVIKTGDTAPAQRIQLVGRDGPTDLTGAQVVMQVRGRPGVSFPADVNDAETGIVFVPRGDLEPVNGRSVFNVEFEVTFPDSTVQTFPEDGWIDLTVWSDLDGV